MQRKVVALKNIGFESNLGEHVELELVWFESLRFVLFTLSFAKRKNGCGSHGQNSQIGDTSSCSVVCSLWELSTKWWLNCVLFFHFVENTNWLKFGCIDLWQCFSILLGLCSFRNEAEQSASEPSRNPQPVVAAVAASASHSPAVAFFLLSLALSRSFQQLNFISGPAVSEPQVLVAGATPTVQTRSSKWASPVCHLWAVETWLGAKCWGETRQTVAAPEYTDWLVITMKWQSNVPLISFSV